MRQFCLDFKFVVPFQTEVTCKFVCDLHRTMASLSQGSVESEGLYERSDSTPVDVAAKPAGLSTMPNMGSTGKYNPRQSRHRLC